MHIHLEIAFDHPDDDADDVMTMTTTTTKMWWWPRLVACDGGNGVQASAIFVSIEQASGSMRTMMIVNSTRNRETDWIG